MPHTAIDPNRHNNKPSSCCSGKEKSRLLTKTRAKKRDFNADNKPTKRQVRYQKRENQLLKVFEQIDPDLTK